MPSARVTYRRKHSFHTESNKFKKVRVAGSKLTIQYLKKKVNVPHCAECGCPLNGLKAIRPVHLHTLSYRQKHVTRAYGGNRCATCVKNRILRAFLAEEQKIVKRVMKSKAAAPKKAKK